MKKVVPAGHSAPAGPAQAHFEGHHARSKRRGPRRPTREAGRGPCYPKKPTYCKLGGQVNAPHGKHVQTNVEKKGQQGRERQNKQGQKTDRQGNDRQGARPGERNQAGETRQDTPKQTSRRRGKTPNGTQHKEEPPGEGGGRPGTPVVTPPLNPEARTQRGQAPNTTNKKIK